MAQRWFVSRGEHVYGPWSTEDVHAHRRDGNILKSDIIWGVGTTAWIAIDRWDPNSVAAVVVAEPTPVADREVAAPAEADTIVRPRQTVSLAPADEITRVGGARPAAGDAWYFAFDGRSLGPFSRTNLIVELRRLASLDDVSLWTKGMREWAPVVEFLDVLNELGTNQRQHARAAIEGQVTLTYDGLARTAPLTSISEGGFGLRLDSELITGQVVSIEVKSPALGAKIGGTAEIRYCAHGTVGFRFAEIEASARANVARYVKQHSASDAKAA